MKSVHISAYADAAMEAISNWSTDHFGAGQAYRYCAELLDRIDSLAQGHLTGQSCRDLIAPDLRADLRLIRAGRHAIIYVETAQMITILDVVHLSADLTARLTDPGPLD